MQCSIGPKNMLFHTVFFGQSTKNGNGLDHQSTKNGNRKIRNQQKTATRSTKNGNGNETKKDT
jgi:hypothetical protein